MNKIEDLYIPFKINNEYEDIKEEKILKKLFEEEIGALETVISRIINETVLQHMNLNMDSTIMQMLFLNDYLINLFMNNFEALVYNYGIHYLSKKGVLEIEEDRTKVIKQLAKDSNIKTTLEEIIQQIS